MPWHIGNHADLTVNVLVTLRRLRVFLVEAPAAARRELARLLPGGTTGKVLLRIPPEPRDAFLRRVLALLEREDVGLLASGGAPCFCDPGAWVVRELRLRGVQIVAQAGPSGLAAVLSLSGVEWTGNDCNTFTFAFFCRPARGRTPPAMREALGRTNEPVVVFLPVPDLPHCLRLIAARDGGDRRVTVFFDLTKTAAQRFPFADQVRTLTAREWLRVHHRVRWDRVSEIALLVHRREPP
jgi:16S rRNA C1402 (ribose-2'-O) methylase RsmI